MSGCWRGGVLATASIRSCGSDRFWGLVLALRLLLLLLLLFGIASSNTAEANGRSFYFTRLSEAQGLARDNVTAFAQDKHGFIWIGTQAGLSRFDGYRVVNYKHRPGDAGSLGDDWVQALAYDQAGNLWVGTRRGLQRFRPESEDFESLPIPAGNSLTQGHLQVNVLIADAGAGLWVGTEDGLFHYAPQSRAFRVFRTQGMESIGLGPLGGSVGAGGAAAESAAAKPSGLSHNRILSLHLDQAGALWVGTQAGVDHLKAGSEAFAHFEVKASLQAFAVAPAKNVLLDAQGVLWVASEIGVQAWELDPRGEAQKRIFEVKRKRFDAYVSLHLDRQQQLWMGMETEGLWRWLPAQRRFEVIPHREADAHSVPKHISTLFDDRFGSLWLGTWASGAYRVDLASGGFRKYVHVASDKDSLADNRIYSVTDEGGGGLWLSSYDVATKFDPVSGRAQTFRFGKSEKETLNLADAKVSRGDKVALDWVLKHTDPLTSQVLLPSFSAGNPLADVIRYISSDKQGLIWLGSRAGLHRIDPRSGKFRTFVHDPQNPASLANDYVRMLLVDTDGDVWVAGYQGLDRLPAGREDFVHYRSKIGDPRSLVSDRVQYIFQDSQARIWVGTAQGLNELVKRSDGSVEFRHLPAHESLGGDPIGGILEDDKGRLWVSTTAGISRLDPKTGEIGSYTVQDGMIEGFYFANSAHKARDGRMYFGGLNGLTGFHPDEIRDNPSAPQLALTAIKLNNEALQPGQTVQGVRLPVELAEVRDLTLGHRHESLSLEFAALHFADPQRNRYAYKLEGFDRDWVKAGPSQRTVNYTNLPAGSYQFKLKAANKDGVWAEEELKLGLNIQAAYWQTWWFRSAAVLLFLGLLWGVFYARLAVLTRQKMQLEAQVTSRTAELSQEKRRVEQTMELLVDEKREVERQKDIVEQAHGHISLLSEMGRSITSTLDQDLILHSVHVHVRQLMPVHGFGLGFLEPTGQRLQFSYLINADQHRPSLSLPRPEPAQPGEMGSNGLAKQMPEWVCVDQARPLHVCAPVGQTIRVFDVDCQEALLAPLLNNGKVCGLLGVYSQTPESYQPWHLDMLLTLASYSAIALENAGTYARLQQTQEELVQQQKFAALGSLVAGVAHELNTPLGNCLLAASTLEQSSGLFAERLDDPAAGLRKAELRDFVNDVRHSSQLLMRGLSRSAELISSFKEVAVDRSSQQRRCFGLQRLAKDVLETLANDLKNKGHSWTIAIAPEVELDSYPGPLGQVLTNLVNNSVLHGFEGRRGGHIGLAAALHTNAEGAQRVHLSYRDDGCGIAPEHMERVFDPFFSTKMGQGGSGLGMSISYNLVHSVLGGEITMTSELGKGVHFLIDLPLQAPHSSTTAEPITL